MKNRYGTLWLNGTYDVKPTHKVSFEGLKNMIIEGEIGNVRQKYYYIKRYKEEGIYPSIVNDYKTSLPYVNMVGLYSQRKNTAIFENSFNWIISWDIDKKENKSKNFDILFKLVCNTPSTILAARTSGGGLRGFSRLKKDAFVFSIDTYQPIMKQCVHPYLLGMWDAILDTHQYTLSQPWYVPYDPNVYFNADAEEINVRYELKQEKKQIYVPIFVDDLQKEFIDALQTLPPNCLHYDDVLKFMSYGKSIDCDFYSLYSVLKSKTDISSSLYSKGEAAYSKIFNSCNETRFTEKSARWLIGNLGGNKKIMKYERY